MDGSRFDRWTRSLALSRRGVLRGAAGAAAGALLGRNAADAANLRSLGNACATNADCLSHYCGTTDVRGRRLCQCQVGTDCPAAPACHASTCIAHVCGATPASGGACDDGNPCSASASCTNGTCVGVSAADGISCGAGLVCATGVCRSGCLISGVTYALGTINPANSCQSCQPQVSLSDWSPVANQTPCETGNLCTADVCVNGVCTTGTAKVCTASDQCHAVGVCNSNTGACSDPFAQNGTPCNDGNPATVDDICTNGVCGGIDRCANVVCAPSDQCHLAGVCDPATGTCSNPAVADGTACDDGDPATQNDVCTAGTCAGVDLCAGVTCAPKDQCHLAGVCDPATGQCTNPAAPDNTACDDGDQNICTAGACQAGVCVSVDVSRTMCDDGNACTTDFCSSARGCYHESPSPTPVGADGCFENICDPHGGKANWVTVPTGECPACDYQEHPACAPDDVDAEAYGICCPGRMCIPDFPGATTGHCGPKCGVAEGCGTACGSYVLAGTFTITDSIFFEDDLVITHNGTAIFDSTPAGPGGSTPPIGPFSANLGDVIAIAATNTYGGTYLLEGIHLSCANGSAAQWIAGGVFGGDNNSPPTNVPFLTASIAIDI